MKTLRFLAAFLLAWAGPPTALAYDDAPTPPNKPPQPPPTSDYHTANAMSDNKNPKLARDDQRFLEDAMDAGMRAATVSEAVLPHLERPEVREFAQHLVKEHGASNRELQLLATRLGVEPEFHKEMTRLSEKWREKTKQPDADYLDDMVETHEKAVKLLEKAAEKAEQKELGEVARKQLPKLREHLERARVLRGKK